MILAFHVPHQAVAHHLVHHRPQVVHHHQVVAHHLVHPHLQVVPHQVAVHLVHHQAVMCLLHLIAHLLSVDLFVV